MVRLAKEALPAAQEPMGEALAIMTAPIRSGHAEEEAAGAMMERAARPKPVVAVAVGATGVVGVVAAVPETAANWPVQVELVEEREMLVAEAAAHLEMLPAVPARLPEAQRPMPGPRRVIVSVVKRAVARRPVKAAQVR